MRAIIKNRLIVIMKFVVYVLAVTVMSKLNVSIPPILADIDKANVTGTISPTLMNCPL